jgi:septal ring factor EnvC (AmiA/AmiB activator)
MQDGEVAVATKLNGYGNIVAVSHNNGDDTLYSYL